MTSGNLSEEPIARSNEEAWNRLGHLADGFLFHNREIYARYDDSVWFVRPGTGKEAGSHSMAQPIRRSRGYAPFPIKLPFESAPILACGAELKNTFCLTRDRYAFLGQHVGDMENLETLEHFETSIRVYEKLFRLKPGALVHDLHPNYLSTQYARERASQDHLSLQGVQHHHAHAVSCMIDHGTTEPVIAVVMDGTGFGLDGMIWGGEWFVADLKGFHRLGWLGPLPLPGGDAAIRNPGRISLAYLHHLLGEIPPLPFLSKLDESEKRIIPVQIDRNVNVTSTTSTGRLFDAVAALSGGLTRITYEAQAAIEMEMACKETSESYPYELKSRDQYLTWGRVDHLPSISSACEIGLKPLFESIVEDVRSGRSLSHIGSRFHRTVARMIGEVCQLISEKTALRTVALSGGCFQNRLLLRLTLEELQKQGLHPLVHHQAPTNDGGLSLGQAAIGHFALSQNQ